MGRLVYKCYNDLKNKTLQEGDYIHFLVNNNIYKYYVTIDHLASSCNDIIFNVLKLDKYEVCKKTYKTFGSDFEKTIFPVCKENDYESLTEITKYFFRLCDNYYEESLWQD
jgi:hypothetical protein